MDVKALEAALAASVVVKACGQEWELRAPSLAEALRIQRGFHDAMPEDADERAQHYVDTGIQCILDTLEADVPRPLVERVVTRTGLIGSPLLKAAMVLCGLRVEEEDDLPT